MGMQGDAESSTQSFQSEFSRIVNLEMSFNDYNSSFHFFGILRHWQFAVNYDHSRILEIRGKEIESSSVREVKSESLISQFLTFIIRIRHLQCKILDKR